MSTQDLATKVAEESLLDACPVYKQQFQFIVHVLLNDSQYDHVREIFRKIQHSAVKTE